LLSIDFGLLEVTNGARVLDVGCGGGRHSFECFRRGADVTAVDLDLEALASTARMLDAMTTAGEARHGASYRVRPADARQLPFADATFDRVIASEVLEHIPEDDQAIAELNRVLKPGGRAAVTVPRWWPEQICWALSDEYHSNPGGHVRIYRASTLRRRLQRTGFRVYASGYSHALHAPYWWLKCLFGVADDCALLPRVYHELLAWDLRRRPRALRIAESALNPVLGKSLVLYVMKAAETTAAAC
jgi:ubiquinone/menaquinone biosynthesis C-methylase UbiE